MAAELRQAFPSVSPRLITLALRESGLPLSTLVEGVRQDTLDNLERTLRNLENEYAAADAVRKQAIRRLVIEAKTKGIWASRKDLRKAEMVLWMRTWLENPGLFPAWVKLRKRQLETVD